MLLGRVLRPWPVPHKGKGLFSHGVTSGPTTTDATNDKQHPEEQKQTSRQHPHLLPRGPVLLVFPVLVALLIIQRVEGVVLDRKEGRQAGLRPSFGTPLGLLETKGG